MSAKTKAITSVDDLTPDALNANRHTQRGMAMMETSLRECGYGDSVTVDREGRVISGNGRVETLASIGMTDAIVVQSDGTRPIIHQRTDLDLTTDDRAKRLALLQNRTGQINLEWDAQVLAELADTGTVLDDLFAPDELNALLGDLAQPAPGGGGDDFDATPAEEQTRVQSGDLWQCGRHRVLCGDCTVKADVERVIGGAVPELVFADPPYGINIVAVNGFVGGGEAYKIPFGGRKTGSVSAAKPFGSKDQRGSDGAAHVCPVGKYAPVAGDETTEAAVTAYTLMAAMYPDAQHVWWGGNYYADCLPPSSCWFVWDKQNTGNFADAELAWTNRKTAVRLFSHMWNGMLRQSERGVSRVHPTQKPVALAEWVIGLCECKGHLLDPFAGSGMSLIAAERTGCTAHLIELSTDYVDVILRRYEAETGETATLLERADG